jgi:hypothetical protein
VQKGKKNVAKWAGNQTWKAKFCQVIHKVDGGVGRRRGNTQIAKQTSRNLVRERRDRKTEEEDETKPKANHH